MGTEWQLTMKPSFLNELNALDKTDVAQVTRKLDVLGNDPTPDAKVKKRLTNMGGKLHRLRAGGFRILYTFESPFVSLLSVRKRDESTYDDDFEPEFLGGPPPTGEQSAEPRNQAWQTWLAPGAPQGRTLPRAVDVQLLDSLGVDEAFRKPLLAAATEEELLECAVPQDVLLEVVDALLGRTPETLAQEPDLLLQSADDLLRFKEGDLLAFLLRLNPEQEKLVAWGVKSDHPTLLKGGPGTGKSTVALYRARAMVNALRKKGVAQPRLLFTTYTRTLTQASEQLLERLLGKDAHLVEVRTADSVVREVVGGSEIALISDQELFTAVRIAIASAKLEGNALVIEAQKDALDRLGPQFVQAEISHVIEARGLTLEEYLGAARPGRQKALTKTQRTAVYRAFEALQVGLGQRKKTTWSALRVIARDRVRSGQVAPRYDGVLVDEVQDLTPTQLGTLLGLARSRGGIFVTADANQSIYGSQFRWKDVQEGLTFQGSTAILRANHRSTREIGEAAESYLQAAEASTRLDEERVEPRYVHEGPFPAMRVIDNDDDEAKLLLRFLRGAVRDLRMGLGACAILVPTTEAAARIASDLQALGLDAQSGRDLDLTAPGVKVITQKSAKGLEFPIVAIAGFDARAAKVDEEGLGEARRTMYVAMTRAMRALLVVAAAQFPSPLLEGFDPKKWNVGT